MRNGGAGGVSPRESGLWHARKTRQSAGSVRTLVEFNGVPGTTVLGQSRGAIAGMLVQTGTARRMSRGGARALPGANAVFERLGQLLVDEFKGKTFFEVSHHPRLDLAEQDQRFQRRPVFRG